MTSKSRTAVGKGKSSVYFQRGMSEEISYEDVLLAQYMNEIQKAPPVRKEREAMLSPYAVSTHTYGGIKSNRPKSAVLSQREKPKRSTGPPQTVIGWSEKADWTSEQQQPKKRNRPVSAPVTRNRLITSKLNRTKDSRNYLCNQTVAKNLKKIQA